jgi:hypothetical protein
MPSVEDRLAELEAQTSKLRRSARLWRAASLLALVVIALGGAYAVQEKIVADEIVAKTIRAQKVVLDYGSFSGMTLSADGLKLVSFDPGDTGSREKPVTMVSIGTLNRNLGGVIRIYDPRARERLHLGSASAGSSVNGENIWTIGHGTLGGGVAILNNGDGTESVLTGIRRPIKGATPTPRAAPPAPKAPTGTAKTKIEARRGMRRGMTEAEVRRLLGEPDSISTYSTSSRWLWRRLFGGIVFVHFDQSGRVESWSGL